MNCSPERTRYFTQLAFMVVILNTNTETNSATVCYLSRVNFLHFGFVLPSIANCLNPSTVASDNKAIE